MPAEQVLLVGIAIASLLAAWSLTVAYERFALRRRVLDIPNERSSHSRPVPRGGGVAIVAVVLAGLGWLATATPSGLGLVLALAPPFVALAVVGWIDDRRGLGAGVRLVVHLAAAAWLVVASGDPAAAFPSATVAWPWLLGALLVVGVVWGLNLFNFMDGIDGIAASHAAFVALGALVLVGGRLPAEAVALLVVIAAASAGFLVRNWSPAKVFMGDVGSGALGILLAGVAVWTSVRVPGLVWVWVVLWGTFLADATVTLLVRATRGERVFAAHRSHCYQHLAARHGHARTTSVYLLIDCAWVLPWAALAAGDPERAPLYSATALLPLAALAAWRGAGRASP